MDHVRLGRTGLSVSRLCLGTMNFGTMTDEAESRRIMDHALEAGVDFIDTANIYGGRTGEGITEQIIGRWLAQGDGRRERVVLATKVNYATGPGPNDRGLSARHIRRACEDSLRRLRTDHIDLYQMHHINRETPWEEIWQAFEGLVREGKVLYTGSSNFAGWNIVQAQELARARHFMGLVSEQNLYNLACRMPELELIPACRACGLGLLVWSPLHDGLLAGGMLEKAAAGRRISERTQGLLARHRESVVRHEAFCREIGIAPALVSLAWLLHNPAVTAPIIGPRTLEQLQELLAAGSVKLEPEQLAGLDAIWPGPGGEAPEAWIGF